uniref:PARG catalytic Macro domain-containing protein n=1 Tax=Arcella intermedia TaxID=1963864 RepID=A0A6B2LDF5_9EUKA|eukprot:TRINITY_DN10518_c0_g1_i1.p1 TRINITY_DN10518_c0_g1~~TRINITY_DN10518_c0_g1_i1.p1  ORF type:complete len:235 (-),score=42.10 TRINITY_DN10518_c0_g1_i1:15-719(-)
MNAEFHAAFVNKYIGGGVLFGGCAQEEMLFAFRTECLVSMLLCPIIEQAEAIIISGVERFSAHRGYAQTFEYVGPYADDTSIFQPTMSKAINIVAVDALVASVNHIQYSKENIQRELNKLYCGLYNWRKFSNAQRQTYATGHWGCGIFGGNKQLKAIEQIIVVSQVGGLDINYYTWGRPNFASALVSLVQFLHKTNTTVGEVTKILFSYMDKLDEGRTPFEFLYEQIRKKKGIH